MSQNYSIPSACTEIIYEIKKSKFIARLCFAADRNQAQEVLKQAKCDYPDARHHCWAYLIGPPENPHLIAMSDDGEPSGTAGKPILNVMQHKEVGDVMLVVSRYFGGIKLGAGGLVRAYSQAAQHAYEQAPTHTKIHLNGYQISCQFADEQSIRHWLEQHQGKVTDVHYSHQVNLQITLAQKHVQTLQTYLGNVKQSQLIDFQKALIEG